MHLLGVIIIGFVVGLIARALMPGKEISGFIITTLLGIGGAVVGQYVGVALGYYKSDEPSGFFMSILGALLILLIFHLFNRKTTSE